jgi:hypothetical protein
MSEATPESYAAQVALNVKNHGFHSTYVGGGDTAPFCYSTGLYESDGLPELFLSALGPGLSGALIHSYRLRFRNSAPPVGVRITAEGDDRFDYYLINVDLPALREYVLASYRFYGTRPFKYLQLVYPDAEMRFPHEPGYVYDQEILGDYSAIGSL